MIGKIKLLGVSLLMAFTAMAQEAPNRVFITDTDGITTGHVLGRLDKVTFGTVEGEVSAPVSVSDVQLDQITLSVHRTPACVGFRIAICPESMAVSQLRSDLAAIRYVEMNCSQIYREDFENGTMSGFDPLSKGSKYRVMTVGYDKFGIACGVSQAAIETPADPIAGTPDVEVEVVDRQLYSFSLSFTPNADVTAYYVVAGEKGTIEAQYDMFAAMFGYNNINEMIAGWGIESAGPKTTEWTSMSPNTEYEVFIAMRDANGNFAPHKVFEVSTLSMGGSGEATVTITPGNYSYASWDGDWLPSLDLTFTPNDQTSCYRFGVYFKTQYDQYTEEEWREEICQDPEVPMAYWFFYEPLTTDFQINTSTEIVALAAAKNADGEWGPLCKLEYTTPDFCPGGDEFDAPPRRGHVMSRHQVRRQLVRSAGMLPQLNAPGLKGITLK